MAADGKTLVRRLEHQLATLQHAAFAALGAAQQGAHARFQLGQLEGLAQVVVGAQVQAVDARVDAGLRGEHQHRHAVATAAQALEHLEAVHARQADVQNHQRIGLVGQQLVGLHAIRRNIHRVAGSAQRLLQPGGNVVVVFY